MKDANGSHFELLLGEADWGRCTHVDASGGQATLSEGWATAQGRDRLPLAYDAATAALTLASRISRFRASPSDTPPDAALRRGAAADAYGSIYWIAAGGTRIDVQSSGARQPSLYALANPAPPAAVAAPGGFAALAHAPAQGPVLRGLAITREGYLVAGCSGGLQVFDLMAGGPALQLAWPHVWPLQPQCLAARPCGGIAVLDRPSLDAAGSNAPARVWLLDRRLGMQAVLAREPQPPSAFADAAAATAQVAAQPPASPWFELLVDSMGGQDPTALLVLDDDAVLVLDGAGTDGFALVTLYVDGVAVGRQSTRVLLDLMDADAREGFVLRGFDCALAPRAPHEPQRLVIAAQDGNQCYAFDLLRGSPSLTLDPVDSYLPMRRFAGKGLLQRAASAAAITVAQDTGLVYDGAGTWLPLVAQTRPRYVPGASLQTPVLDSDVPECTWHRLVLDACIPPGCSVQVQSRAADSPQALADQPFVPEPLPMLRPQGSELPWLREAPGSSTDLGDGRGSWELLFQRARGRYLQLRLTLRSQELGTPRLVALRAWCPRFSYLHQYLPALYREDGPSADFLERFLANFEGLFTSLEDRIVAATALLDVRSAPDATLDWLASWLGLVLDPAVPAARKRLLIRFAVPLFAYRGTTQGLRLATELVLSDCVKPQEFALPASSQSQPYGIRIIERFLTRRVPPTVLGQTVPDAPRWVEPQQRWSSALGAEDLQRRYDAALGAAGLDTAMLRPIRPEPEGPQAEVWSALCLSSLGALPQLASTLRGAWQRYLQAKAPGAGMGPDLPAFWPQQSGAQALWRDFVGGALSPELRRWLGRWQAFIARRYQRTGQAAFVAAWGNWPAFELLPAPDRLPLNAAALTDWAIFETRIEPMVRQAHRFSVLLPSTGPLAEAGALAQRMDFARRVVALEKPAHTSFDVRPYWAMFRIGQARAGLDTLLGIGSRDPAMAPQLIIGSGHVGASRVATGQQPRPDRLLLAH